MEGYEEWLRGYIRVTTSISNMWTFLISFLPTGYNLVSQAFNLLPHVAIIIICEVPLSYINPASLISYSLPDALCLSLMVFAMIIILFLMVFNILFTYNIFIIGLDYLII